MRIITSIPVWRIGLRSVSIPVLFALVTVSGCVQTESWVFKSPVPASGVSQINMIWTGLTVTQDSANKGDPLPGFAGRLYLVGMDAATPLLAEGKVVADMLIPAPDSKWRLIERWEIDPKTLQRLARKDFIGEGYTLFLPWPAYNAEVTQAQMRVVFYPKAGDPIYGQPSIIHVHPPSHIPIETKEIVPTVKSYPASTK
ncbi:MAG: hypothetical protein U0793_15985 [Gemmataceae bacterium]